MVFFGLQDAKSQRLLKFTLDTWQYLGPVALRNADFTETFVGAVGEQLGPFIYPSGLFKVAHLGPWLKNQEFSMSTMVALVIPISTVWDNMALMWAKAPWARIVSLYMEWRFLEAENKGVTGVITPPGVITLLITSRGPLCRELQSFAKIIWGHTDS